jgi:hypothetical protein
MRQDLVDHRVRRIGTTRSKPAHAIRMTPWHGDDFRTEMPVEISSRRASSAGWTIADVMVGRVQAGSHTAAHVLIARFRLVRRA